MNNAMVTAPMVPKTSITADEAMRKAESFIFSRLGNLLMGGTPRRVLFPLRSVWMVPVLLTYPGYGTAGEVGMIAIMVLAYFGIQVDEDTLRHRSYTTLWGTSTRDAVHCVRSFGLHAEVVEAASFVDCFR